jgi:transposase
MGRPCAVCFSDDRDAIEIELASGRSQRSVATQYGRSAASVRRHANAHLRPGLARVAQQRTDVRFSALVDRMAELVETGQRLLDDSTQPGGDQRVTLAAIREVRETISAVAKLSTSDQAVEEVEEVLALLLRAMGRVLPRYPEVAAALADELRELGDDEFSEALDELAAKAVRRTALAS